MYETVCQAAAAMAYLHATEQADVSFLFEHAFADS